MKLLLDTHVFLWWISDDRRLSLRVRRQISKTTNEVSISVASAWEIVIKSTLGRSNPPIDPSIIEGQAALNGFDVLPIKLVHALGVAALPALHEDPFDRMLVSQARSEGCTLVTGDEQLHLYPIKTFW